MQHPPRLHNPCHIIPPLRPRDSNIIAKTALHKPAEHTTALQNLVINKRLLVPGEFCQILEFVGGQDVEF